MGVGKGEIQQFDPLLRLLFSSASSTPGMELPCPGQHNTLDSLTRLFKSSRVPGTCRAKSSGKIVECLVSRPFVVRFRAKDMNVVVVQFFKGGPVHDASGDAMHRPEYASSAEHEEPCMGEQLSGFAISATCAKMLRWVSKDIDLGIFLNRGCLPL